MSDTHAAHGGHGDDMAHDAEHRHGYSKYVVVGVILTVITIVEIMIPSIPAVADAFTRPGVVASLLILSFAKGAGVVAYYMHLRDDNRLFTALFMFPFTIASVIVLILFLFFSLTGG